MFPIFQSTDAVLAVILCLVAFAFWVQRFKVCKMIGPALIVIILGILLVNLKIVPESSEVYGTLSTYCIPISMSLCVSDSHDHGGVKHENTVEFLSFRYFIWKDL